MFVGLLKPMQQMEGRESITNVNNSAFNALPHHHPPPHLPNRAHLPHLLHLPRPPFLQPRYRTWSWDLAHRPSIYRDHLHKVVVSASDQRHQSLVSYRDHR